MSELAITARCTHCNKLFAGPQLLIVGTGVDAPTNRLMQFMEKLTGHMMKDHQDVAQRIMLMASEYQGMLILGNYQHSDASLMEQADMLRWKLHQNTLACRFSDEQIQQWVSSVLPDFTALAHNGDTATLQRNLAGMLMTMRDRLEEPGKYIFSPFSEQLPARVS